MIGQNVRYCFKSNHSYQRNLKGLLLGLDKREHGNKKFIPKADLIVWHSLAKSAHQSSSPCLKEDQTPWEASKSV